MCLYLNPSIWGTPQPTSRSRLFGGKNSRLFRFWLPAPHSPSLLGWPELVVTGMRGGFFFIFIHGVSWDDYGLRMERRDGGRRWVGGACVMGWEYVWRPSLARRSSGKT